MSGTAFNESHHLFKTYVFFRSNLFFGVKRQIAKSSLHHINYGAYDTKFADRVVEHMLNGEPYKIAVKKAKKELKDD